MTLAADIATVAADTVIFHTITNGDASDTVTTESGEVDTVARAISKIGNGNYRGAWAGPGTVYAINDTVTESAAVYRCITGHTSAAAFVTDAAKWVVQSAEPVNVTNAQMADMAQATVKGRRSGAGTGKPTDLTKADQGISGVVVSVTDYPYLAVGDGVTDDTNAIQDALDDNPRVHIPAGTYLTSSPLLLSNDCHVTGDGWRNTIIYNPTTTGMKRKLAGDARDFYLADFQIASANDSVNNLIGLDLTRVNYSIFVNICTRFHRVGTKLARVEGGTGNCYFNTFYSLKTLSNQTGLLLADDGTGVVPNKNTFFDTFYEDVGVWTGSNSIDLSGYGNAFFGIYAGHSGGNSCVKLRAVAGNNVIHSIYGESTATYLIDNAAGTLTRKNQVFGTHIDSGTMVKVANAADVDLLIDDKDGHTGDSFSVALSASETGRVFKSIAMTAAEPFLDLNSKAVSGKRFRLASGGGGIGSVGYFILHDFASGRNPIQIKHDTETSAILADVEGVAIKKLKTDVIATGSLPAASSAMNGRVVIEDAGAGNRNLIIYAGGERFRIDGGATF